VTKQGVPAPSFPDFTDNFNMFFYFDATAVCHKHSKMKKSFHPKGYKQFAIFVIHAGKRKFKFATNILNFKIEKGTVRIRKSPRKILPSNDCFFQFSNFVSWGSIQRGIYH
jgi:hypothetical protein